MGQMEKINVMTKEGMNNWEVIMNIRRSVDEIQMCL